MFFDQNKPIHKKAGIHEKVCYTRVLGKNWLYSDGEIGQAGDSVIFKSNNIAYGYSDIVGTNQVDVEETPFHLINDSTINMDDEIYKIRKLTETELYLHEEEVNTATNEKYIYKLFFQK
jgi:hypothetical protein